MQPPAAKLLSSELCVGQALFVHEQSALVMCVSDLMFGGMQEAAIHAQETQHSEAETKMRGQLRSAQGHIAQLESQLAIASDATAKTQLAQSLQLKMLSEQHSTMLSQLRLDHEMQLKAATEHHEVPAMLFNRAT